MPLAGAVAAAARAAAQTSPDQTRIPHRADRAGVEADFRRLLTTLTSFGTRSTLSDTTAPARGIGAARQWILDELRRSSPRLQVEFETFRLLPKGRITKPVEIRNVVAVLPGRTPRRIYVTGHYDTLNIPGQTAGVKLPDPLPPGFDYAHRGRYAVDAPARRQRPCQVIRWSSQALRPAASLSTPRWWSPVVI